MDPRVQLLLDKDEIRELAVLYAHRVYIRDWRGIGNLFTEDGVLDYADVVRFQRPEVATEPERIAGSDLVPVGPQAIADFIPAVGRLEAKAFFSNHIIRVDGDSAVGIVFFENRLAQRGESVLGAGRMCDEYRRVDGRWLISYRRQELFYFTGLKEGWAASLDRTKQPPPPPQRGWEDELIRSWGGHDRR